MRDLQQMAGHAVRRAVLFRVPRRPAGTAQGSRRKKKMAVARLGGGGGGGGGSGWRRRRRFLGALRRLRLRWMALLYGRALRQLRECYAKTVRDFLEGAALIGAVRADAGV